MILELADIRIHANQQAAFDEAIQRGIATVITKAHGYRGFKVNKGVESPERYVLMIFWETLENHTVDFREAPAFPEWRAIVGPFFAAPTVVALHPAGQVRVAPLLTAHSCHSEPGDYAEAQSLRSVRTCAGRFRAADLSPSRGQRQWPGKAGSTAFRDNASHAGRSSDLKGKPNSGAIHRPLRGQPPACPAA